ncbi:MAG: hypothetical protein IIX88_00320, partial [Firmicutes bacterium]|nr:hypothetical protein [Bacillota bacterium]
MSDIKDVVDIVFGDIYEIGDVRNRSSSLMTFADELIKTIVSAELPMDLERKGQQSYQGSLNVRFLVFGNGTMKSLYDRSEGFFRRQIIITVQDKDKNREDDPFLAEKLCS